MASSSFVVTMSIRYLVRFFLILTLTLALTIAESNVSTTELTSTGSSDAVLSTSSVLTPVPAVTVTACEMTTERRLTVIKSSGFPSSYVDNVSCKYVVKRYSAEVCSVTFLFNVFDLENSPDCSKDFVDIHGEKLCGSKPTGFTRSVSFRGDEDSVVMVFHSDNTTSGVGFMTTVVQQECPPPDCDHKFEDKEFELRSPNFPAPYSNRQLCDYTIVRSSPTVCRLRLEVRTFDVESAGHCDADSVEIKGNKLCGNLPPGEIITLDFTEPLLVLRFRSDHATTRDGFHLMGSQEECPVDSSSSTAANLTTTTTTVPTASTTAADSSNITNTSTISAPKR